MAVRARIHARQKGNRYIFIVCFNSFYLLSALSYQVVEFFGALLDRKQIKITKFHHFSYSVMHNNFLSLYHNINCQFDITTNVRLKKKTIKIWKNYVHHRPASRQFRQMFSSTLSTIVFFFNEPVHKTLYIRVAVLSSWIGFPASV